MHCYWLVHADLPAVDEARGGKPTVHKAFNEETAILAGDALRVLASLRTPTPACAAIKADTLREAAPFVVRRQA